MTEGEMMNDSMLIFWDFKYLGLCVCGGGALNSMFALEGLAIYRLQGIVLRNFL